MVYLRPIWLNLIEHRIDLRVLRIMLHIYWSTETYGLFRIIVVLSRSILVKPVGIHWAIWLINWSRVVTRIDHLSLTSTSAAKFIDFFQGWIGLVMDPLWTIIGPESSRWRSINIRSINLLLTTISCWLDSRDLKLCSGLFLVVEIKMTSRKVFYRLQDSLDCLILYAL